MWVIHTCIFSFCFCRADENTGIKRVLEKKKDEPWTKQFLVMFVSTHMLCRRYVHMYLWSASVFITTSGHEKSQPSDCQFLIIIIDHYLHSAILCFRSDSLCPCCMWFWTSDCSLFIVHFFISTDSTKLAMILYQFRKVLYNFLLFLKLFHQQTIRTENACSKCTCPKPMNFSTFFENNA